MDYAENDCKRTAPLQSQVNKSTSQQVDWPHTDITDSTEFF